MSEPINAMELDQETVSTLDGSEQIVMFDNSSGKRISISELARFLSPGINDAIVEFETDDSLSPEEYADGELISGGTTIGDIFRKVSTMIKNIRYIWNLIGNAELSTSNKTIIGAINENKTSFNSHDNLLGNDTLDTETKTVTGAINEQNAVINSVKNRVESFYKILRFDTPAFEYNSHYGAWKTSIKPPAVTGYKFLWVIGVHANLHLNIAPFLEGNSNDVNDAWFKGPEDQEFPDESRKLIVEAIYVKTNVEIEDLEET